jgi:hypothetical protein
MSDGMCTAEGCPDPQLACGYCNRHYKAWKKYGDPLGRRDMQAAARARFLAKTDRRGDDECWPWLGYVHIREGYGSFWLDGHMIGAHRAAYLLFVGPIPGDLTIDHVRANGCTRKDCVNWVRHLEAVTEFENLMRGNGACARNARKTHCKRRHKLTPDNTYINPKGARVCRICVREGARRRKVLKRAAAA